MCLLIWVGIFLALGKHVIFSCILDFLTIMISEYFLFKSPGWDGSRYSVYTCSHPSVPVFTHGELGEEHFHSVVFGWCCQKDSVSLWCLLSVLCIEREVLFVWGVSSAPTDILSCGLLHQSGIHRKKLQELPASSFLESWCLYQVLLLFSLFRVFQCLFHAFCLGLLGVISKNEMKYFYSILFSHIDLKL